MFHKFLKKVYSLKKHIFLPLIAVFIVACSDKNIALQKYPNGDNIKYEMLEFDLPQSVKSLPNLEKTMTVNDLNFKDRYFRVWDFTKPTTSKNEAFWGLNAYKNSSRKIYIAPSRRAYSNTHFKQIEENANTKDFGKISRSAITVKNTFLRNTPSHEPIFYSFNDPGEGYPFDYLANSTLGINYPLYVSHFSKDGDFAFVQNDAVWGWVDSRDIRFVSQDEKIMMKNSNFITILTDRTPIYDMSGNFLFYGRVGTMLMSDRLDSNFYYGKVFTSKGLQNYRIKKSSSTTWPAAINSKNVKQAIDSILGEPYGWGGFSYYRDCSLFTKDFLATFGYWLPRNSKAQSSMYTQVSLAGLTNAQKLDIIKAQGVPYFTILYMPGHVMLYTGIVNGKVSITHNAWGLRTKNGGRALFGQTAITTLEIGKDNPNIADDRLLLSRLTSMSVVAPELEAGIDSVVMRNLVMTLLPTSKAKIIEKAYDVKVEDNRVIFKDGSSMTFDDGKEKTEYELLNFPDVEDMIVFGYPNLELPPKHDIGRVRNHEFLGKIYGSTKEEIWQNLVKVKWINGKNLSFNSQNGAADSLKRVVTKLNDLIKQNPNLKEYLDNPAGTFNYRKVEGQNYLSAHSYGIAIDINYAKSNYYRHDKSMIYKNSIPLQIVEAFESEGFIWGGRWMHYDTMHFEYRPEFFVK